MKRILLCLGFLGIGVGLGWFWQKYTHEQRQPKTKDEFCEQVGSSDFLSEYIGQKVNKLCLSTRTQTNLEKYTVPALKTRRPQGSDMKMGDEVAKGVYKFSFKTEGRLVTGLAHVPSDCSEVNKCPVIVQSRGYIYPQYFVSGSGTSPSAREYVKAGFVTLAPDFLGYGGSDKPSENIFEARFQTYTTLLDLLSLIKDVNFIDANRVGLWGHSNGGQITLTVLEATGRSYPTVLWAPVTAPFPYSILFYSDSDENFGKGLRKELARFEEDYDTQEFAMINYLDLIAAPIQLHFGGQDELVPIRWGREVIKSLRKLDKEVEYYEYPNADHNMKPDWEQVMERDIIFLKKLL